MTAIMVVEGILPEDGHCVSDSSTLAILDDRGRDVLETAIADSVRVVRLPAVGNDNLSAEVAAPVLIGLVSEIIAKNPARLDRIEIIGTPENCAIFLGYLG